VRRDGSQVWPLVALLGLTLAAAQSLAADRANDGSLEFRITELNKTAVYLIEEKQFDAALKRLLEAERLAKEAGDVGQTLLPRTYVNLGALLILGTTNPSQSTNYFMRALCRQPEIRPSGYPIARPAVVKAFDAVRAAYRSPPRCRFAARNTSGQEPDLPVKIAALDCPNPDEAFLGFAFTVRCAAAPRLAVERVTLFYRRAAFGSDDYVQVDLRRTARGWWTGVVPKEDVQGKSIAYYFEGTNAAGQPFVANGAKDSPNIALVMEPERCGCDAFDSHRPPKP